jgi:L-alanine-DL-glutamate epimerase-like enolase superfamily enzyme
MDLSLESLKLKLNVPWKLSRNTSLEKNNFIVTFKQKFKAEVAPNIRYQETPERIIEEFNEFKKLLEVKSYDQSLTTKNWAHSLRFALESVWLKAQAHEQNLPLWKYLGLNSPRSVETSFSLPIMEIGEVKSYLSKISRFKSLKVKLNSESAFDLVREVSRITQVKLRLDGNEAWVDYDLYKKFEEKCKGLNIEFIEQPFPSDLFDYYKDLKKQTPYLIMADESVEDELDVEKIKLGFHAINVKLMKAGSLLKAVNQLKTAHAAGLKTMIGCMIETSQGIEDAMMLNSLVDYVDLDGFLLIQDEPFQLVQENNGILALK